MDTKRNYNENDVDDDDDNVPIACQHPGCQEEAQHICAGCANAAYCTEEHMLNDWKNHIVECSVCIQDDAAATPFTIEYALSDDNDADGEGGEDKWIAANLVHAHLSRNGLIESSVTNQKLADITGPIVTPAQGLRGREISARRSKVNKITPGKRQTGTAFVHISAETLEGAAVADTTIPVDASTHSVTALGASGITIEVRESDIDVWRGDSQDPASETRGYIEMFPARGKVLIGLELNKRMWQVWGEYNMAERLSKKKGAGGAFKRLVQMTRHGVTRIYRRAVRHSDNIRMRGQDDQNVQVSLLFKRSAAARVKGAKQVYLLSNVAIHVPPGARETRDPFTNVFAIKSMPYIPQGEPVDAECLEEVVGLMDNMADCQSVLQQDFADAQNTHDPERNVKDIQTQLNEASRIRNVLKQHADTLYGEEQGTHVVKDIDPLVLDAIRKAEQLVESNIFTRASDRLKRARARRLAVIEERKKLGTMTDDQVKDYFRANVKRLEDALAANREGTPYRLRAQNALDELDKPKRMDARHDVDSDVEKFYGLTDPSLAAKKKRAALKAAAKST